MSDEPNSQIIDVVLLPVHVVPPILMKARAKGIQQVSPRSATSWGEYNIRISTEMQTSTQPLHRGMPNEELAVAVVMFRFWHLAPGPGLKLRYRYLATHSARRSGQKKKAASLSAPIPELPVGQEIGRGWQLGRE